MNSCSNERVTAPTLLVLGSVSSVNQPQETKMFSIAIIERAAVTESRRTLPAFQRLFG